jgi:hypothetical protein
MLMFMFMRPAAPEKSRKRVHLQVRKLEIRGRKIRLRKNDVPIQEANPDEIGSVTHRSGSIKVVLHHGCVVQRVRREGV